jgi:hypothetical protein
MTDKLKFTKITSDGIISDVDKMTLKEMQEFVGGYIEYVGNVICNEDGRMLELPVNKLKDQFVGNIIIQNWFDEDD